MSKNGHEIGYGKPPATSRFRKGQSGNPSGRPRGRHQEPPYEAVLGQNVTIREGGVERQVSAAEAFLLHMTKQGLEGDSATARTAMGAIEEARSLRLASGDTSGPLVLVTSVVKPGSVNSALEPLRMARKLDRYRKTARVSPLPTCCGSNASSAEPTHHWRIAR